MEARGIEPRSRDVSTLASTCVVTYLISLLGPEVTRSVRSQPDKCPDDVTRQLAVSKPAEWRPSPADGHSNGGRVALFRQPWPN